MPPFNCLRRISLNEFTLKESDKSYLLKSARETISSELLKTKPAYDEEPEILRTKCGAFVTLHKEGKLRGCIGHMVGYSPLFQTVREMAEASAFHDPRFPPVSLEELNSLEIEISVLTPLRKIDSPELIEIGKHGIYIEQGSLSGVLLPQVATEYHWDRETFLTNTCRKAGLNGNCWENPSTKISIFSAIIFSESESTL